MAARGTIFGTAGALALSAALAVAPTTSASAAPAPGAGVDYTCSATPLGKLVSWGGLPLHLDALQTVTVPTGGVVKGLTTSAGLSGLVGRLSDLGLGVVFGVSSLSLQVGSGLRVAGSMAPDGRLTVPSFALSSKTVPGTSVPISAPAKLVLPVTSGLLGSVSCVLDDAGSDVLGTVLVGPASTDTSIHPAQPPTDDGGSYPSISISSVMQARLVSRVVLAGRHARVKVRVWGAEGVQLAHRVTVTAGGRTVGQAPLSDQTATVRIAALGVGKHSLRVRVGGLAQRLPLHVVTR